MFHGLLVSSGFSNPAMLKLVGQLVKQKGYRRASILTTAHPKKETAPYAQVTKEQLEALTLSVAFVDLERGELPDKATDVLYVCGGNTFRLLKALQQTQNAFHAFLETLFAREGLYIGSSAGAVIVSPSIHSAEEIHPDRNTVGVKEYTSLGYIEKHIIPHYRESLDPEIATFMKRHNLSKDDLLCLRDGEGVYVHNGVHTHITQ